MSLDFAANPKHGHLATTEVLEIPARLHIQSTKRKPNHVNYRMSGDEGADEAVTQQNHFENGQKQARVTTTLGRNWTCARPRMS